MTEAQYLRGVCEACGERLEFPVDGIGLSVSCPHCGQPTTLLEDLGGREVDGALSAAELSAAIIGPVRKCQVSVIYQSALLLVACFMVVLPIVYLGLIVALAYGIYWYAVT